MNPPNNLTKHILIGMGFGILVGAIIHNLVSPPNPQEANFLLTQFFAEIFLYLASIIPTEITQFLQTYFVDWFSDIGAQWFLKILKMLIVPVVFISLVCGTCSLDNSVKIGKIGIKSIGLYLITTGLAIILAITVASISINLFQPEITLQANGFQPKTPPSLKEILINLIPNNPIKSFTEANMLQIIFFAIVFGIAIAKSGEFGKKVGTTFNNLNHVMMNLITMMMYVAPFGVFFLMVMLLADLGVSVIQELWIYFITVIFVLILHAAGIFSLLLTLLGRLNPIRFFSKMRSVMLFAFSTSSSNATLPITLNTVENKLGVNNSIASFTIPLGATINMDGTAIMQGVATVFIAHHFGMDIGIVGYLTVVLTAMLASIGTAGVPGVGMITLGMVLEQAGLPVEGIALIIGVDRLLDMVRTAVNVTGDAAVSCIVAKSEGMLDLATFKKTSIQNT